MDDDTLQLGIGAQILTSVLWRRLDEQVERGIGIEGQACNMQFARS